MDKAQKRVVRHNRLKICICINIISLMSAWVVIGNVSELCAEAAILAKVVVIFQN